MTLMQPGQHFDGVTVVDNPVFVKRAKPRRVSAEQQFFARAVYAAQRAFEEGLPITAEQLHRLNRELPLRQLQELVVLPKFADALAERGISVDPDADLSAEQLAALAIYLDTSTPATHRQKLKAAGVSEAQWRGWMKQRPFVSRMSQVASDLLRESVPLVFQRLAEGVDRGDKWAMEMALEVTGAHDRRGDGVDVQALVKTIFDVLDEEVRDVAVLERIAGRIRAQMGQVSPVAQVASRRGEEG